jgi:RHS repeat-associated protein
VNRLLTATATSYAWGQSYSYDGFGNLTGQTVTYGSAPSYSVTPDPATNHVSSADANGNSTTVTVSGTSLPASYDVANRMVFIGYGNTIAYSYAPGNKRVWRGLWTSGSLTTDELTYWSVSGQKLGTYTITVNAGSGSTAPSFTLTQTGTNYYFGRKLIKNAGGYVGADRLGSIGKFYPYGQEKPSATTNGTEKFTGYFRDAETGLDYADQRFHNPGTGRFLTPDPYRALSTGAANPSNPGSWNKYAYVLGDPINFIDRRGLMVSGVSKSDSPDTDPCFNASPEGDCPPEDNDYDPQAGGGGVGGPTGAQDPNCSTPGWSAAQTFDYSTIKGDANALGVNLAGFTVAAMQMVGGTQYGGSGTLPASQTELVLTGTQAGLSTLLGSMCITQGYNANSPNCFMAAGYDPFHGGTASTQINYRQDTATYSMQISGSVNSVGVWTLNIDIDPNNPSAGFWAGVRHTGNVLWNGLSAGDTNYQSVAAALSKRNISGACQ